MRETRLFIGLALPLRRPTFPLALALAAAACGGGGGEGSGPEPEPLAVSVQVQGTEQAHLLGGGTATLALRGPTRLDLVTSAATTWTVDASGGPVIVTPQGGSTSTRFVAVLAVPTGASGTVTFSGESRSALGQAAVRVTVTDGRAYFTGDYPDLFVDVLGKTEAEVQTRIDDTFAQLFTPAAPGNPDDAQLYFERGDGAYVQNVWNNGGTDAVDIRSEGMSYAMMIAVQLDKQDMFDRLWRFSKANMQHASGPLQGYFAWQVNPDLTTTSTTTRPYDPNPAPDGEEWYATALFMASHRWGDGAAPLDYGVQAQAILDAALHKHEQADRGSITDMFDATTRQVVFQPLGDGATFTDPSYHLPAFYELWARWADKDNAFWCAAAAASRAYLLAAADDTTGLSPDYARFDGTAFNPSWSTTDHSLFRADAQRVGANIGVDQLWFHRPGTTPGVVEDLLAFLRGDALTADGVATYCNTYTLAGECKSGGRLPPSTPEQIAAFRTAPGFVAMNAAAVQATAMPTDQRDFLLSLWSSTPPVGKYQYYGKMLYMLGLLEASGHLRVWGPAGDPVAACD